MSEKDGGSAFPTLGEDLAAGGSEGMTLRDYFAAQAMSGWIGDGAVREIFRSRTDEMAVLAELARGCYAAADAMLKERAK